MSAPIPLRQDFDASQLRGLARRSKDGPQARRLLYRVPEILTLGRFPDARESDSRRRTEEVRHVGSDTVTPGF